MKIDDYMFKIIKEEWTKKDTIMYLTSLSAIVLTIAIVLFYYAAILSICHGYASKNWPTTEGKIISSKVDRELVDTQYGYKVIEKPVIKYEYMIKKKYMTGSKISFGQKTFAVYAVKRYPPGKVVKVIYNPSNPSEAVLETGFGVDVFEIFFLLTLMLTIVLFVPVVLRSVELGQIVQQRRKMLMKEEEQTEHERTQFERNLDAIEHADYEKLFCYLTWMSHEYELNFELCDWHLPHLKTRKSICTDGRTMDDVFGYQSLGLLVRDLFDDAQIDLKRIDILNDVNNFHGLTQVLEDFLSKYTWMQLIYKDSNWRIASYYNIELYNANKMKSRSTHWDESLVGLLNSIMNNE